MQNVSESSELFTESEELLALLAAVRGNGEGKNAAFSALVKRYANLLKSRSQSFGKASNRVGEAYQEACLALQNAAGSYKPDMGLTFGLYARICIDRTLISWQRKDDSLPFLPLGDPETAAIADDFVDPMIEEEKVKTLLCVIDEELSPYEFSVFHLHAEGASSAEIAKRLGKESKSVSNAKNRILQKLRARLGNMPK